MGFWATEPGRRRKPGHGGSLFRKLRQENHELEDCLNYIATPGFKKEKEKNEEWFVSFLLALSTLMTTCRAVASHTLLAQGLKSIVEAVSTVFRTSRAFSTMFQPLCPHVC